MYFNIFFAGSESVVKIPFSVKKGYFFYRAKVYVNYHKQHFTFYRNSYKSVFKYTFLPDSWVEKVYLNTLFYVHKKCSLITINGIPRFSESVI